jgi:two-component system response regulator ChvI
MASVNGASNPGHIVVVDDEDLFREALDLNLTDEGCQVTSFASGQVALNYFATGGTADVVLLDWRVPV